jgi:curved DNA-binding protein CbpA
MEKNSGMPKEDSSKEIAKAVFPSENQESESLERFESNNPYTVLGISENATVEEIKSAWKNLIMEYHPDKSQHPKAKEITQKVIDAVRKLVSKDGTLAGYRNSGDGFDYGVSEVSDEEWNWGNDIWHEATNYWKYTDYSLRNQNESQEERDYVLRIFSDKENDLSEYELVMPSWSDDGSYRIFYRVGYGPGSDGAKQMATEHKMRIYNSKGEIVFGEGFKAAGNNTLEGGFHFVKPSISSEVGEIQRVAEEFGVKNKNSFIFQFIEIAESSPLVTLDDDMWSKLENTDSWDVTPGSWDDVAGYADQVGRNWEYLKQIMEDGQELDAPIIAKMGEAYHLVSGNTRLMVARAKGITPQVLIVDISELLPT